MYQYKREMMNDTVFNFVYGCAMHDAILQKAFDGEKKWVGQVAEAKTILRGYVDKVLNGEFSTNSLTTKTQHDACFLATANAICTAINNSSMKAADAGTFSYGNAQKLINMTMKHLYAHTLKNPALRECFRFCHCPVDSIMLSEIWKMYDKTFGRKKRGEDLGPSTEFLAPWGNEGVHNAMQAQLSEFPERYTKFQNAILTIIDYEAGDIFPIEFDYLIWKNETL